MKNYLDQEQDTREPPAPIEFATVVRGVARRWRILLGWIVVSLALASVTGLLVGQRAYEAEAVLLYRPQEFVWTGVERANFDSLSLNTQLNLVKVRSNLEEARERMSLPATLERVGQSIRVTAAENTNLLVLSAKWDDPESAATLANTIRDVFLQSQVHIRYREELALVTRLYDESRAEFERLRNQIANLGRVSADLQARIAQEAEGVPSEGLINMSVRAEQIRDAIYDDRTDRANLALYTHKEIEYEKAKTLFDKGAISAIELDEIRSEYEKLKALAIDTDQIGEWRGELDKLKNAVIPKDSRAAPSAPLLQEVMLRAIEVEFDLAATTEKVAQLERLQREVENKLERLQLDPTLHSDGPMPAWLTDADFRLVTDAKQPTLPAESNRRIVAFATLLLLMGTGIGAIGSFELLPHRIRSAPELSLKLGLPALGVLPEHEHGEAGKGLVAGSRLEAAERYRILGERVRHALPEGGRLLVTSANHAEGRTTFAMRLAAALGDMGTRVLLVEASSWRSEPKLESGDWRQRWTRALGIKGGGLASFLARLPSLTRRDRGLPETRETGLFNWADQAEWTGLNAVQFDPHRGPGGVPVLSDLSRFLDDAAHGCDLLLIDAPPTLPYADVQAMAPACDGALLIVRAERSRPKDVRAAATRIADSGLTLVGSVLCRAQRPFLDLQ
jgi:capsular polysaccharide biosynthesis protein